MPEEKPSKRNPLVWESDVIRLPNGRVELVAREPMKNISAKQAAKLLGVSTWTVTDLYRLGLLDGFKPGARKPRKDGKASNAALRLDAGSVLKYKEQRETESPFRQ